MQDGTKFSATGPSEVRFRLLVWEKDEIIIGNNKYTVDHTTGSIKRYNEKSKVWVRVTFGCGIETKADELMKTLSDEYIRQCLNTRKSPT